MWYVYFRRVALAVFAVFIGVALVLFLAFCNMFPVKADAEQIVLEFPFLIEGTDLIAEYFVSYEGDFFEDASDTFLINGAALCVYNRGENHIDYASVYLETLDGVYCFEGTCIPPHSKVIILEKYRSAYPKSPVYYAAGKMKVNNKQSVMDKLQIEPIDMGRICVSNKSREVLENVYLYYKRYDSLWDIYVGGITYAVCAESLQQGESVILSPANYANGYSKVFYATAD